jgi:SAM-dependent methyltransferase
MDPIKETINTYNSFAEDYKKRYQSDKDGNRMQVYLDKFVDKLKGERTVLDVGSGAGFDAKYLSDKGLNVTSIDLADKLLEVAREIAPNVSFIKMDMRQMTFNNGSFDGIWSSASLLHLPKSEVPNVLNNFYNILRSDGILCVSLKQGEGEGFVTNKGEGNLEGAHRYFSYYSKKEVEDLLSKSRFVLTEYTENTNRGNIWMFFIAKKA